MTNNNNKKKPKARKSVAAIAGGRSYGGFKSNTKTTFAPAAMNRVMYTMPASMASARGAGDGTIIVKHREFVGDIVGSVAFAVGSYGCNPGMPSHFPWLSNIARNYETYTFRRLRYMYEPSVPTSSPGALYMYMDYDAADSGPLTKSGLMSNHGSARSSVWAATSLTCDNKDLHKYKEKFCRYNLLAANLDIKTYDLGTLYIAVEGYTAATTLGDLFVEYEVEFHTPQHDMTAAFSEFSGSLFASAAVTKIDPIGSAPVSTGGLDVSWVTDTAKQKGTFNELGDYLWTQYVTGTGLVAPTLTGTTDNSLQYFIINAAATAALLLVKVRANAAKESILADWSGSTTLSAIGARIAPYLYTLT